MLPVATTGGVNEVHSAAFPAKFVALDIETGHADEKTIEAAIARWTPPSNVKDAEKVEVRRVEALAKIRERSALLDGAPIICVAVKTEKTSTVFNGVNRRSYEIKQAQVVSGGSERGMLVALRDWLDQATNESTTMVGFTLLAFDLPRLRSAFLRHKIRLPRILTPRLGDTERQPIVDVMRLFVKYFSAELHGDLMVSLDEVIDRLELPRYKERVNGSMIPDLAAAGKVREILTYCAIDVLATWAAYLVMTGNSTEAE